MKNLSFILGFLALTAQSLTAGNVTTYPNVSSVAGSDIFFDWQSGAQQNATGTQLKAFITGGGTLSIGTGKTLTSSNTLTFAGTDGSSVNFGTGGTVLYSLGIGSSTQAYSAKLDALAALASPGTSGYVLSATTGGTLSWVSNSTPNATTSGTKTTTATPSPALTSYTTGLIVTIRFANANTAGSSLNLNGLGAVTIQKDGAAITAGQLPANTTAQLVYDGTNFQLINSGSVVVSGSQSITALSNLTTNGFVKTTGGTGTLSVDTSTYLATTGNGSALTGLTFPQITGAFSADAGSFISDGSGNVTAVSFTGSGAGITGLPSVHTLSGTLTGGTTTVTVPAGVSPWVQGTNTGTVTNSGALAVSVSGTTATVKSSNALDTSTFNLFYYQ